MMKIIVDEWADQKIQYTALYIQSMFGVKARMEFQQDFHRIIKLLRDNPNLGPVESALEEAPTTYRSIVVNRLNKIIYWINNGVIEIVDFGDTRMEPESLARQLCNRK